MADQRYETPAWHYNATTATSSGSSSAVSLLPPDALHCPSRRPRLPSVSEAPRRGLDAGRLPADTPARYTLVQDSTAAIPWSSTTPSPASSSWMMSPIPRSTATPLATPLTAGRQNFNAVAVDWTVRSRRVGQITAMDAIRDARLKAVRAVAWEEASSSITTDEYDARRQITTAGLHGLALLHCQYVEATITVLHVAEERQRSRAVTQQRMVRAVIMEKFSDGLQHLHRCALQRSALLSQVLAARRVVEDEDEPSARHHIRFEFHRDIHSVWLREVIRRETERRAALWDQTVLPSYIALAAAQQASRRDAETLEQRRYFYEDQQQFGRDELAARQRLASQWLRGMHELQIEEVIALEALHRSVTVTLPALHMAMDLRRQSWRTTHAIAHTERILALQLNWRSGSSALILDEALSWITFILEPFQRALLQSHWDIIHKVLRQDEWHHRTNLHHAHQAFAVVDDEAAMRLQRLISPESIAWAAIDGGVQRLGVEVAEERARAVFVMRDREAFIATAYRQWIHGKHDIEHDDAHSDEHRQRLVITAMESSGRGLLSLHSLLLRLQLDETIARDALVSGHRRLHAKAFSDGVKRLHELSHAHAAVTEEDERHKIIKTEQLARCTMQYLHWLDRVGLDEKEKRLILVDERRRWWDSTFQRAAKEAAQLREQHQFTEETVARRTVQHDAHARFNSIVFAARLEKLALFEAQRRQEMTRDAVSIVALTFAQHLEQRCAIGTKVVDLDEVAARQSITLVALTALRELRAAHQRIELGLCEGAARAVIGAEEDVSRMRFNQGVVGSVHSIEQHALTKHEVDSRRAEELRWWASFCTVALEARTKCLQLQEAQARILVEAEHRESVETLWKAMNAHKFAVLLRLLMAEEERVRTTLRVEEEMPSAVALLTAARADFQRCQAAERVRLLGRALHDTVVDEGMARSAVELERRLAWRDEVALPRLQDMERLKRASIWKDFIDGGIAAKCRLGLRLTSIREAEARKLLHATWLAERSEISAEASASMTAALNRHRLQKLALKARTQGKPFIGISLAEKQQHFSRHATHQPPLYIDAIYREGPAHAQGLQLRDEILRVGAVEVTSLAHVRHMISKTTTVGGTVELTIRRYAVPPKERDGPLTAGRRTSIGSTGSDSSGGAITSTVSGVFGGAASGIFTAAASGAFESAGSSNNLLAGGLSSTFTVVVPVLTAEKEYRELPDLFFDTSEHEKLEDKPGSAGVIG